ncbi:MAG TPA: DUF748 domain-containing protein [Ohtaekwangia sp.]|nr:DUF748 domain-containing protein [Ohtaekwangia sp.]
MKGKSRLVKWSLMSGSALLVLAVVLGIWIPSYIKKAVNDRLQNVPDYKATYTDIDVTVWKGAYVIHKLQLAKPTTNIPVPFFRAEKIKFSIDWNSILSSSVVCNVSIENPIINFVRGPSESTSQTNLNGEWIAVLHSLTPVPINNFSTVQGAIWFRDFHSFPKIEVVIDNITLSGSNLRNQDEKESILPASITGKGNAYNGDIALHLALNPLQSQPLFEMNASLTGVSLVKLGDFLKVYYNLNITKGSLDIHHISKVTNATVQGSVKTFVNNVSASQYKTLNKNSQQIRTDSLFELASWRSSSNHPANDSLVIEGKIREYSGDMWSLIGETLTYAFNCSIRSSLEQSVKTKAQRTKRSLKTTDSAHSKEPEKKKGFLEKLFGKKDDKEKKSKN